MQVALNGDEDYVGDRLIYATNGKIMIPERPEGTITIHNDDIVHGVSKLISGVRYGLFFLQKKWIKEILPNTYSYINTLKF